MPYKNRKYKRFSSQKAYDKFEAFLHIHNIPHDYHKFVEIKKKGKYIIHKVNHKINKTRRKIEQRYRF